MSSFEQVNEYVKAVRRLHPLVHCITNTITIWDCANLLLAAGASPTMAHHPEEVAEITAGCHALVLNFGAMDDYEAMLAAAPVAAKLGHPIIVDPVGCGGSAFRRERFKKLAETAQITCVRGNASEIKALAMDHGTVTGVDAAIDSHDAGEAADAQSLIPTGFMAGEAVTELDAMAADLARRLGCIVIASGPVDTVTDGKRIIHIHAGDAMMSRITGTGCMSSALLGAYLSVEKSLEAAAAAVTVMGLTGEEAAKLTRLQNGGTMTFHQNLIDLMSLRDNTI